MKKVAYFLLFIPHLLWPQWSKSQDFAFSQYWNSPSLTNPAAILQSSAAQIRLNYRYQELPTGDFYSTALLSGIYPLLNQQKAQPWGAISLSLLRDNQGGLSQTNGVLAGAAYRIYFLNSELNFGLQGGFFQRHIGDDTYRTDSQFTSSGFDPNLPIQESLVGINTYYGLVSTGLQWTQRDEKETPLWWLGVAWQNINRPTLNELEGFTESFRLPSYFTGTGGFRLWSDARWSISPQFRWINRLDFNYLHLGADFSYHLDANAALKKLGDLHFGAWYYTNQAVLLAFTWDQPKFLLTFSYDVALGEESRVWLGNGALELTLGLKIARRPARKEDKDFFIEDAVGAILEQGKALVKQEPDSTVSMSPSPEDSISKPIRDTIPPAKDTNNLALTETVADDSLAEEEVTIRLAALDFPDLKLRFSNVENRLTPTSLKNIDELAQSLVYYEDTEIEIVTYEPVEALIQNLGKRMKNYLIERGVKGKNIFLKIGNRDQLPEAEKTNTEYTIIEIKTK